MIGFSFSIFIDLGFLFISDKDFNRLVYFIEFGIGYRDLEEEVNIRRNMKCRIIRMFRLRVGCY